MRSAPAAQSPRTPGPARSAAIALACLLGSLPAHAAESAPHWAFQPVTDPRPPAVTNSAWCRTPLDRFILARIEDAGVRPAPPADPRTLLRRISYDLTGLPPTAAELDALAADPSPDALDRAVERLLESPRYGEHWGRHWLDVVRYADTAGETADYPVPVAWRYRNYVIDAFNADKPYDEFLREQVAGDILARGGPRERYAELVTATGFLAVSRRFGFDSENYHHLTIQDTIDTLGQGVLGLTLGCARCHAHKYDPVPMSDYYALYGIFESTRYAFPGSEQKQRHRALVPLVPPSESAPRWREFERRVAALAAEVSDGGLPVPSAVLRSLDEMDGDFEMQAPAAGGSKGVLVPPWDYTGPIAVTTDAQSPFRNLHPGGRVGASLPAGTNACSLGQSLHPRRTRARGGRVFVNLDFKVTPGDAPGRHALRLGPASGIPAFEILVGATAVELRTGERVERLHAVSHAEWLSLQLELDLGAGTVAGSIGNTANLTSIASRPLAPGWNGSLDRIAVGPADDTAAVPALLLDNLAVQDFPIPARSTAPVASPSGPRNAELAAELQRLAGIDGDFELQTDATPPAAPWGPGPNSGVKVSAAAQSPFTDLHPPGRLGLRMPNSGAYNGFGQTLTNAWKASTTGRLHAAFDFRCGPRPAGGNGSWRFYLGHGPGTSAAIELFFNGSQFFRRNGDARDAVRPLAEGEWNQVRLDLDLKARRYTGSIRSASGTHAFEGAFPAGWDGTIDYTFIDSYGHLDGVKPELDADNFIVGEAPLPAPGNAPAPGSVADAGPRRARIDELKREQSRLKARAAEARRELEQLLIEGPFDLAYAVSEGTPRDARVQLRGEPDRPGDPVQRGFVQVLGTPASRPGPAGSGRLELADWLASRSNPLTARVMVNRIWQYHFGQGLVRTPNDFGLRGQRPTHPELLDWLASRFMESGWSVKAMHRLILSSAVYRQRSRFDGAAAAANGTAAPGAQPDCPVDPAAVPASSGARAMADVPDLFTPFVRRRLSAEEIRDTVLLAAGALEEGAGAGHPFPVATGWGYTQHGPFSAVYEHQRRSVYLMTQRIKRHPFLALFDGADPNTSTAERRTTTVPTQALYFLNDPFVHANAARLAARAAGNSSPATDPVRTLYRLALGRDPIPEEITEARQLLAAAAAELGAGTDAPQAALASLARVLLGSNEFLTVD